MKKVVVEDARQKGKVLMRDEEKAQEMIDKFKKKTTHPRLRMQTEYNEVDKMSPLGKIYDLYTKRQRAKGVSDFTIKAQDGSKYRLNQFICDILEIPYANEAPLAILIEPEFMDKYREWMRDKGYKESTIHTTLTHYKALLTYCADEGWIPQQRIKLKNYNKELRPIFTQEQLNKLLVKPKIKNNFARYRDWVIMMFALGTGARCGSIVHIQMKDCAELSTGYITLNMNKSKKPARVAVPDTIIKIVKEYIRYYRADATSEDYLFCNQYGQYWNQNVCSNELAKLMKATLGNECPPRAGLHLLRHTFAATYIMSGGSLVQLQHQLLHSDSAMTLFYANHYGEATQESIEAHNPINALHPRNGRKKIKETAHTAELIVDD